ncbi:BrnT family toxin [Brasilonema bromeliae]|uniref:BrnT family toxin n=1 Tax=Brasilonema bromeliae SPC951 TaxID=385972 RepID=A0ABX1PEF2_9CYAN|nr:BrnT family toxin [Brasilonema bromeliae]NMG22874.1 BrnT family toxin [Brasilonema bromeliae SPC951]
MSFEWNDAKDKQNIEKHGIRFEEAKRVFNDPFAITREDCRFDYGEIRKVTLGEIPLSTLATSIVVVVVHTERDGHTRIISARKANKKERAYYEQNKLLG